MHNRRFTGFKKLVSFLGADYDIMIKAGSKVQERFYFAAVIIMIIFVISFLSIRYAVNLLFHSLFMEVFLSLFLSSLFVCIYIFLLHTFAKKGLGKEVIKKTFRQSLLNPSNFLRTGFVIFMGFVIAKPIEIYVFQPKLDEDVHQYKEQLLINHQKEVNDLFGVDIARAEKRIEQLEKLGISEVNDEINTWEEKIDVLNAEKQTIIMVASQKIATSDFFIYRARTVMAKYRLSYFLCAAIIFLFLLPGYLIYTLSENDAYYELKKRIETALVLRSYHALVKTYTDTFASRYGLQVELYSVYEDPPFNTKRKAPPTYQAQAEFLKKFSS
ncbi:MAG: DUF4407 domain-containing protein [Chitinophagaceae bacterium]|nr:MAG: DUF4407 domain-containing protein [Chitinophagaceae bacterium]